MPSSNAHIVDYLTHYIQADTSPGFALMVAGHWGAGKTHLVKRAVAPLQNQQSTIVYLSLYGMASTADIDRAIFFELNPVFADKRVRLAAKFGKALLKGALKVDLDNDGNSDGTVNVALPELSSSDLKVDYHNLTFVFDDVERATIPATLTLGYLNQLIETMGCKVILIANEEKLAESVAATTESDSGFAEIKEKLVGTTLTVLPELEIALDCFLDTVSLSISQHLLRGNRKLLIDIYKRADQHNLRRIKHALFDIPRLIQSLPQRVTSHKECMAHLLEEYLTQHIEYHAGRIQSEDFEKLGNPLGLMVRERNGKELDSSQQRAKLFNQRHPNFRHNRLLLPPEMWLDLIVHGRCDSEKIGRQLLASRYFDQGNAPAWAMLWHLEDLPDDDIVSLMESVLKDFASRAFLNKKIFLHVVGELLLLAEAGVYPGAPDDVVTQSTAYIDNLEASGKLLAMHRDPDQALLDNYLPANVPRAEDTPEFKEIRDYLEIRLNAAEKAEHPAIARELLQRLAENPNGVMEQLNNQGGFAGDYAYVPLFATIDGKDFVEALLRLPSEKRRSVILHLKERYDGGMAATALADEAQFVAQLVEHLKQHAADNKGAYSAYELGRLADLLKQKIDQLDGIH